MTFKFEVDLNNLEMYNNQLDNRLSDLKAQIADLDNLIAVLPNYWEGQATDASVNTQIRELKEVDNAFEVWVYEIIHW